MRAPLRCARLVFVFSLFFLILAKSIALAEIQIDSIRDEGKFAIITFTYTHKGRALLSMVKVQCSVSGAQSIRERGIVYIANDSYGGIRPGFSTTQKFRVSLKNGKAENIACRDTGRILIIGNGGGEGVQKPFPVRE